MKRIAAVMIASVLAVFSSACGPALVRKRTASAQVPVNGFDYPPVIAANYLAWAQLTGITNLSSEPDFFNMGDYSFLFIDDLSIKYIASSMNTLSVDLFFMGDASSGQDTALRTGRAFCFFAALEMGKPDFDADDAFASMFGSVRGIYEKLSRSIEENEAPLTNGESILFYVGDSGLEYSISLDDTVGLIIHAE